MMKMPEIRKRVVLISFSTKGKKFHTPTERNQFFRELYGFKQVVVKGGKRYNYDREGLLGSMPHIRVEDSVFMVPEDNEREVEQYFDKWKQMVDFHMTRMMLLEKKMLEEMKRQMESFENDE